MSKYTAPREPTCRPMPGYRSLSILAKSTFVFFHIKANKRALQGSIKKSEKRKESEATMVGWVYAFVNPTMPGRVKLGATNRDPVERLHEANSCTWLDCKFSIAWAVKFEDAFAVERRIHVAFAERRTDPHREFFRATPDEARSLLELIARAYVEPLVEPTGPAPVAPIAPLALAVEPPRPARGINERLQLGAVPAAARRSPTMGLRLWVEEKYTRVPLHAKDTGTRLEELYSAYTAMAPPVHARPLGKILFAKMIESIYPGIGGHRGKDGSKGIVLVSRVDPGHPSP